MNNNGRGPTWKIIATAAAIVIASMIGWLSTSTYSKVENLERVKVDKEQYYKDIGEIKAGINCLMEMHLEDKKK